ncbi:aromatic alcohol reductase [Kushneria indalinina]|uniref:NmrA-like family protein n=1 Tax=Kushneria indalinina DSM 14324 TaxID=1122140 RepID=A0A3D9E0K5_9GAMM|nr:aromatic alcohol reductase [Kushneria indalinina]REC96435.1 NmrA-like family protein [Kushneria indalinina DSM 14324]
MNHTNRQESILVLGAGELGFEVLRHLAQHADKHPSVRIYAQLRPSTIESTDPAKKQHVDQLRALGIETVAGDVATSGQEALAALLAPYDTVISCIGFSAGRSTQVKITKAVLKAEVKRYVPWQFGVDYDTIGRGSAQDVFDEQLDVRDLLRAQSGTEWLIVATGMFTSFLFDPSFGVVDLEHDSVHALGSWENRVTVTTPEDIGLLTTVILFHEPRFKHDTIFVAGDTLSYGEMADELERQLGRTLTREAWSTDHLSKALAADPDNNLLKYHAVFAAGGGVAWPKETTFNYRQGIETVDVSTWISRHLVK